ncbi:MAG: hypothetical protein NTY57_00910 [Solirubrobacterales bacterium]|nr:hypothetical protein [Solirubrobacterales bacterium]
MSSLPADAGPSLRANRQRRGLGLDWFDWSALAGVVAASFAIVVPLLLKGRTWSGGESAVALDQLQYLAWIREAGNHGLIGNRWDFAPDSRVFLHPGFLISGLLFKLGVPIQAAYAALWKPVAAVMTFAAALLWVRSLVVGIWARRGALFIVLFAVMPWSGLVKFFNIGDRRNNYIWGLKLDFMSGEIWTVQPLQGYSMTAIAIALMVFVLLGIAKRSAGDGSTRLLVLLSLGSGLVMWLQPWQGGETLLIIGFVEGFRRWRYGRSIDFGLVWLFVLGAIPAVYYAVLSKTDAAWKLAGEVNQADGSPLWGWPWWVVLLTLAPLGLPALFALRRRDLSWGQAAARFWPLAALIVFLQPFGTFPFHSAQGLMFPIGVLAVQGMTSFRPRWVPRPSFWWVVPVLVFLSVPGTIHKMWSVYNQINKVAYPYYVAPGEQRALRFLELDPEPGGVMTDEYGGLLIPAYTGREAFIGPFSWTPNYFQRALPVGAIFGNFMSPAAAQAAVESTGARFIFQACHGKAQPPTSLRRELGQAILSTHDFGCARVYVLRASANSDRVSSELGVPDGG